MKLRTRIRNFFSLDQLKADGGTLWRDPSGKFRRKRLAKFAVSGGLFASCLFFAIASIGLPFPGKVQAEGAEATTIYARDGQTELYKIRGDKNRTRIEFDQMPKCIKDATVDTEDKTFYKHSGLDPRGVARAVLVNFELGSSNAQGGSTITQQLVKNALLSPERTYTRKAKELVLSLEIEQMFTKDRILELYLNEIPYGSNAYGIEAASQTYFGKHAKDLNLAECATLAGIPRAPTFYSPFTSNDPDRLKNRTNFVLDQMVKQGSITEAQANEAKQQVASGLQFAAARGEDIKAPHFVFYVREQLEKEYGTKQVEEGGMKVVTTLDPDKQKIAEEVIQENAESKFKAYGASNAALTSVDPKTGQILAMVGSVDYFNTEGEGNVNVATSERQPGSSFKPIVYLAGFKKAYDPNLHLAFNPATLLWDVKTDFGGGYSPNNYDGTFRGPVSARDALQQSLNVPAVKMLDLVGIGTSLDLAHNMGITTLNDPDRYGDSLVLGGGEVKLVDMTSAYGVMANQGTAAVWQRNSNGTHTTSTPLLEVRDRKGKVLDKYKANDHEVFNKDLAYQISDVLSDDAARAPEFGRGSALTLPGRPAAAKTGTTDSFRDAWTLGYTPQLAAGGWIGNNDNSPMDKVGGSIGAAPIWQEYMERALKGQPVQKFEKPDGIKEMKVDKLTGLLPINNSATKTDIFTSENAPRDKSPVKTSTADTCKPQVSITSPPSGEVDAGRVSVSAEATAGAAGKVKSVEVTVDGRSIGSSDSSSFSGSTTLSAGSHTITATATGDCEDTVSGSGLHSERPTNPNWEDPVQRWIKGHGLKLDADENAQTDETATDSVTVTVSGGQSSPLPKPSPSPVTLGPVNRLVAFLQGA
jgi:1A family penicillin-binding protein